MPIYGGRVSVNLNRVKSIFNGDSSNVFAFTLENHWGTHVDAPNHVFGNGKKIADYHPEFWFFRSPKVIHVALKPSEILMCDKWIRNINTDTDILLFKSGWGNYRKKKIYSTDNPGIHPEVGIYLRKKYPRIRAIGIDWISISPYQNRELGREAHKAFLDSESEGQPILIIEDMYLPDDMENLNKICVLPLLVEGMDSAPCTIVGIPE